MPIHQCLGFVPTNIKPVKLTDMRIKTTLCLSDKNLHGSQPTRANISVVNAANEGYITKINLKMN